MTDVCLINPGGHNENYQGLAGKLTAIEPPLWVRLIAGYLIDRGVEVDIIDQAAFNESAKSVGQMVTDIRPVLTVVVAYGHNPNASTQSMPAACELTQHIGYGHTAICGGHPSALPEKTWNESGFDFVIKGEGPETILKLYNYLRNDAKPTNIDHVPHIPGLVHGFTPFGLVESNPPPPLIKDLDKDLHGAVWGRLPMSRYRAHSWQGFGGWPRQPYASIYTTLGCPYACSFCCINAPFGGSNYRRRSPQAVASEVRHLYDEYGVRTFKIVDEMFALKESHVLDVCEAIKEIGVGGDTSTWLYGRIDTVTDKMLGAMREAGMNWIGLGIESGSKHVRDGADKHFTHDDIIDTVRRIEGYGINVAANYIYGLPDDTMETMQETLALAMELRTAWSNHYTASAFPGSQLYRDAICNGWRLPETWAGYAPLSYETVPLPTETLSSEQVLTFRDKAFQTYFKDPSYLEMMERRFGPETKAEIEAMTAIKLKRKILGD